MTLNFSVICLIVFTQLSIAQLVPDFNDDIADSIINKSTDFIKSRVGEKYFNSFIIFDPNKSFYRKSYRIDHPPQCSEILKYPHYSIVYNVQIPDMGKESIQIELITDTLGNIISECFIDKIPNCPENNCWNYFPKIKKDEAIQIAKSSGLEKGLKDWIVSFQFFTGDFNNYVWSIKNYLSFNNPSNESRSSGEIICISANDGTVVQRSFWAVMP
jgi:hypothetical protein